MNEDIVSKIRDRSRKIRNYPAAYFIVGIFVAIFYSLWGWIGAAIAIPVAIVVNMSIGAFQAVRLQTQCQKEYHTLSATGLSHEESLLILSKSFHPELSESTHKQIISKFNDIDRLVCFYTGALPEDPRRDESALEILNKTTMTKKGEGAYSVRTRW
ncbi:hypothetical protein ACFL5E_02490 [Candidatus Omnitrophota bacterium]